VLIWVKKWLYYIRVSKMKFEKFKPENYKNVDIKFTLRLPEELHKEIADYSNKHNVSMNTLILNCIEYAMSNREDK
jgi:predicted HicB family RNase H-like nuclease